MDCQNEKITRRSFMASIAAAGLLTGCTGKFPGGSKESVNNLATGKDKPNLLFVLTDQQSYDMLGCYGNEQIITPNIDSFARKAVRFNHCISSQPVCTPYRGMLMTGQHPLFNGCFSNDIQLRTDTGKHFGDVLSEAGYSTGYIGKWHLYGGYRDRPIPAGKHRHGFDVFQSNNCHVDYSPDKCFYWDESGNKQFFNKWEVYGQADQACEFIDKQSQEEPFALFVSWHPPHDVGYNFEQNRREYDTIDELMELYDTDKIKVRANAEDTEAVRQCYHGHMAMITGLDKAFGQVMEKLEQKGLTDNTLVVFTADHGDLLYSHGITVPKSYPQDESVRVPLLVAYPGKLPAASQSDLLVGTLDLMPTVLSLMDLPVPKTCQGRNLADDILNSREDTVESVPLMYFAPAWRGVYTKKYTYSTGKAYAMDFSGGTGKMRGYETGVDILFDKKKDPLCQNNLYDNIDYADVKQQIQKLNEQWLAYFEDDFLDSKTILKALMDADKIGFWQEGKTGQLTGRPVDILKEQRK